MLRSILTAWLLFGLVGFAEAQDYPLKAPNNWFGTTDREKIRELIFDKHDDEDLAELEIEPILDKPVDWK